MAQIRYEDIQDAGMGNNPNQNRVGFFSLKNDGDEAIVRIMHDSVDSFEIVSTHQIEVNGKYRRINCCRTPHDPIENCPICATGKNAQPRFYVHLIQYSTVNGQIVAEPKIWERPASFATTVKNLILNYGPLSNSIFKIHRSGAARSMDTTYEVMYMPPQQFPDNVYIKASNAFDGYSAIGTVVMDRTPADIVAFLQTGNFPVIARDSKPLATDSSTSSTESSSSATPQPTPYTTAPFDSIFPRASADSMSTYQTTQTYQAARGSANPFPHSESESRGRYY